MTDTDTDTAPAQLPEGFLAETATLLTDTTAEQIADAVLTVCLRRGVLSPELDEEPADALRAEQLGEVFTLLDAATAATADGSLVPARVFVDEELDPDFAALWEDFLYDAQDETAAAAAETMIATGTLTGV